MRENKLQFVHLSCACGLSLRSHIEAPPDLRCVGFLFALA